jgi:tetratricopeptide (TPR) repeat protein
MIIDNADDKDIFLSSPSSAAPLNMTKNKQAGLVGTPTRDLGRLLPQTLNGSCLITSRERSVAVLLAVDHADIINTDSMSDTESLTLLTKKLVGSHEQADAEQLVKKLDFMPLAITQAAAYINANAPRATIPKYLALLAKGDSDRAKLLSENVPDSRRDGSRSNSCIATWHISFERIQQLRPSAARLLSLMSLFNRQGIPEHVLIGRYAAWKDVSRPVEWWRRKQGKLRRRRQERGEKSKEHKAEAEQRPEEAFEHDWSILNDFSLITTAVDGVHFAMHSLVQYSTKRWLEIQGVLTGWEVKYLHLMNDQYPQEIRFDTRAICESLYPHAVLAVDCMPPDVETVKVWVQLLFRCAKFAQELMWYEPAKEMYKLSAKILRRLYGEQDLRTRECVRELGSLLLSQQSTFAEAESYYRDLLQVQQATLGPQHLHTLETMRYLEEALIKQRKLAEAEKVFHEALQLRIQNYGLEHEDTRGAIGHRSFWVRTQGQHEESVALERLLHEARKSTLGDEHDFRWSTNMTMIGEGLKSRGKLQEAENVMYEGLQYCERTLGTDHERTISSVLFLAGVYESQKRYDTAEKMYRRWGDSMRKDGKENDDTRINVLKIADLLKKQNKLEDAEECAKTALETYEKILGYDHDITAFSRYILAGILHEQKRLEEALILYENAYPILRKMAGEDGEDTKSCLASLNKVKKELAEIRKKEIPMIKVCNSQDSTISLDMPFIRLKTDLLKPSPFLFRLLRPAHSGLRRSRSSISSRYMHHSTTQYRVSAPVLLVAS